MIGVGIGTRNLIYKGQAWDIVRAYKARVTADGGTYEGISCLLRKLNNL